MSDINRIILTGRVGKEPEIKEFDSGAKLVSFTLAVNKYDSKKKEEVTEWFTVKTFSKLGEYITKGSKIALDGKLQADSWEKDGEKKKAIYVMAENIQILNKKSDNTATESEEVEHLIDEDEIPF